ncbi:MAG TPA: anti-sigma factor [Acidimicrobiales bacterium]|nr:anti-sigma factor [Acidimicrobiales bacterium]
MTHEEIQELLGAFALDAVDASEAEAVEAHLPGCPRCRAEVEDHRETASLLAFAGTAAPEDLWNRIAAGLEEAPPALDLAVVTAGGGTRPVRRGGTVPAPRRLRWLSGRVLAAAAVVISVVALGVAVTGRTSGRSRAGNGEVSELAAAAVDPSARHVHLASADAATTVELVLRGHEGWLARSTLPALGDDRTYQVWGVKDGTKVSLAVLGNSPGIVRFPVGADYDLIAITAERAPGVVSSQNAPVVAGAVPAKPPA